MAFFSCLRVGALAGVLVLACAAAATEPSYFLIDGNPAAVKYQAGRLVRLPVQDADDEDGLQQLEAVRGLLRAERRALLADGAAPSPVQLSAPRMPEYGQAMFAVSSGGAVVERTAVPALVWSGAASFREIRLAPFGLASRLQRRLVEDSRRALAPMLDFRSFAPVGRRLALAGPVSIRGYGRTALAPHLAFVDITWAVKDLPEALANRAIDSLWPYFSIEYVIDTRRGRIVYRNIENTGGVQDRGMRLFKEARGPLLMAVVNSCLDGGEPLILDLEHETYGTGSRSDVPPVPHCFPAL